MPNANKQVAHLRQERCLGSVVQPRGPSRASEVGDVIILWGEIPPRGLASILQINIRR